MIKITRKFNGKKYEIHDAFPGKREATSAAKDLRAHGDKVRVVKSKAKGQRLKWELFVR